MSGIRLEAVSKEYTPGVPVVDSVTLEVKSGEFLILVGPSGCGKSTVLRMIAGLESITAGIITMDGQPVNDVPPKDRDVAMVFQNYALYPHLSVADNMGFGLKLRGMPRAEIRERVVDAAGILGIEALLERKPAELSGGQRQRVAVGRAIVRKPRIFLFDEPLSNLDARLRVQMRMELTQLHRRLGITMIYVTHDQVEAMTMGDRIAVMHEGTLRQLDAPLDVYARPADTFVASFIGSPSMNLLHATIFRDDGVTLRFSGLDGEVTLYGDAADVLASAEASTVEVGVRPEAVRVAPRKVSGPGTLSARFHMDIVEPMGPDIVYHASRGGVRIVGRQPTDVLPEAGYEVDLHIDLSQAHYFDPESGKRLN